MSIETNRMAPKKFLVIPRQERFIRHGDRPENDKIPDARVVGRDQARRDDRQ
jgi:hypothetical protein